MNRDEELRLLRNIISANINGYVSHINAQGGNSKSTGLYNQGINKAKLKLCLEDNVLDKDNILSKDFKPISAEPYVLKININSDSTEVTE